MAMYGISTASTGINGRERGDRSLLRMIEIYKCVMTKSLNFSVSWLFISLVFFFTPRASFTLNTLIYGAFTYAWRVSFIIFFLYGFHSLRRIFVGVAVFFFLIQFGNRNVILVLSYGVIRILYVCIPAHLSHIYFLKINRRLHKTVAVSSSSIWPTRPRIDKHTADMAIFDWSKVPGNTNCVGPPPVVVCCALLSSCPTNQMPGWWCRHTSHRIALLGFSEDSINTFRWFVLSPIRGIHNARHHHCHRIRWWSLTCSPIFHKRNIQREWIAKNHSLTIDHYAISVASGTALNAIDVCIFKSWNSVPIYVCSIHICFN